MLTIVNVHYFYYLEVWLKNHIGLVSKNTPYPLNFECRHLFDLMQQLKIFIGHAL